IAAPDDRSLARAGQDVHELSATPGRPRLGVTPTLGLVPESPVTIAQVSDLHIVEPGQLCGDRVDTAAVVRAAVAHLNALVPTPDLVLLTGDLVDNARPAQYDHLRSLLAPLKIPLQL